MQATCCSICWHKAEQIPSTKRCWYCQSRGHQHPFCITSVKLLNIKGRLKTLAKPIPKRAMLANISFLASTAQGCFAAPAMPFTSQQRGHLEVGLWVLPCAARAHSCSRSPLRNWVQRWHSPTASWWQTCVDSAAGGTFLCWWMERNIKKWIASNSVGRGLSSFIHQFQCWRPWLLCLQVSSLQNFPGTKTCQETNRRPAWRLWRPARQTFPGDDPRTSEYKLTSKVSRTLGLELSELRKSWESAQLCPASCRCDWCDP